MEQSSALARPYMAAAFEHAKAQGEVAGWGDTLRFLAAVVQDPAVKGMIADPRVTEARLAEFLLDVGADRMSPGQQNFVRILVEADRIELAPRISELFDREQAASEGRARVQVVSAFEMEEEALGKLKAAIARRLGCDVDVEVSVDKALIGGVVIRTGDTVIDGSVRGRLRQLAAEFA